MMAAQLGSGAGEVVASEEVHGGMGVALVGGSSGVHGWVWSEVSWLAL